MWGVVGLPGHRSTSAGPRAVIMAALSLCPGTTRWKEFRWKHGGEIMCRKLRVLVGLILACLMLPGIQTTASAQGRGRGGGGGRGAGGGPGAGNSGMGRPSGVGVDRG